MFTPGDIAVYLRTVKRRGIIKARRGFMFEVIAVHHTGHWVTDKNGKDHGIWHLRRVTEQEKQSFIKSKVK